MHMVHCTVEQGLGVVRICKDQSLFLVSIAAVGATEISVHSEAFSLSLAAVDVEGVVGRARHGFEARIVGVS